MNGLTILLTVGAKHFIRVCVCVYSMSYDAQKCWMLNNFVCSCADTV